MEVVSHIFKIFKIVLSSTRPTNVRKLLLISSYLGCLPSGDKNILQETSLGKIFGESERR
jgi:hypothetical protein